MKIAIFPPFIFRLFEKACAKKKEADYDLLKEKLAQFGAELLPSFWQGRVNIRG